MQTERARWEVKLTTSQVQEIRRRREEGATTSELAREFEVGKTTIKDLLSGRTWRRVA